MADLHDPWLIAVWPGMGNVAIGAGAYLVDKLGAELVHELPSRHLFDLQQVEIKGGLVKARRFPRSLFFEWKDPASRQDVLIFIGEGQPSTGGYGFCHKLLDYAMQRGVKRLFTFAAMATQLHPSQPPRVFGVATDSDGLKGMEALDVEILQEGQISGLNGVLLAAGAERGIPGACLLGELPFFAVGVPNPRASQAALEVFTALAGIEVDFTAMSKQAKAVEKGLLELLEKMKEASRQQSEGGEEGFTVPEFAAQDEKEEKEEATKEPSLDYATRRRIEAMFEDAGQDRSRAFQLKEELDRLGVFGQYEDRFLDLFKKAD